jgi:hypothetical protein
MQNAPSAVWSNSKKKRLENQKGVMTSISFQVDPNAMRILNGQPADGYQRRRERERSTAQGNRNLNDITNIVNGHDGRSIEALSLLDRNVPTRPNAASGTSNENGPRSSVRFLAAGGRPLDLDQLDYEDLYRLFPSHAPRGAGSDVIETCSNVFRSMNTH